MFCATCDGWGITGVAPARYACPDCQGQFRTARQDAARIAAVPALPPDPTDPPPGIVLPAGMGGELDYFDSILVRQLDVWGGANIPTLALLPSGDTTGTIDTAAMQKILTAGGNVQLSPGTYYTTGVSAGPGQWIYGAGIGSTFLKMVKVSAGDTIRMFNPSFPTGGFLGWSQWSGGVKYLTIDGTSSAAGSTGLHIGDGELYDVDIMVQNFSGAGSSGILVDNSVSWTEKMRLRAATLNCTVHVNCTVTNAGGHDSMEYSDFDLMVYALPNQIALLVQAGAFFTNARIKMRGNFNIAALTNTGICLSVTGNDPNAGGGNSHISRTELDIAVEANQSGSGLPTTISFGSASNFIGQCYGRLAFGNPASWAPSTATWPLTSLNSFAGLVYGDTNISAASSGTGPASHTLTEVDSPVIYSAGTLSGATGAITDQRADFFESTGGGFPVVLSASITVGLGGSGGAGSIPGPQHKTIVIKQAHTGGPFTVSWPHNASPTTSLPTVLWAGGTAPVMTATADAVDVYLLHTFNGATWYGQAIQNVS